MLPMTPRTVVFSLPEDITVEEAYKDPRIWHFSRIPVYGENNEDLVGLVDEGTPVTAVTSGEFISAIHDRLAAKL